MAKKEDPGPKKPSKKAKLNDLDGVADAEGGDVKGGAIAVPIFVPNPPRDPRIPKG